MSSFNAILTSLITNYTINNDKCIDFWPIYLQSTAVLSKYKPLSPEPYCCMPDSWWVLKLVISLYVFTMDYKVGQDLTVKCKRLFCKVWSLLMLDSQIVRWLFSNCVLPLQVTFTLLSYSWSQHDPCFYNESIYGRLCQIMALYIHTQRGNTVFPSSWRTSDKSPSEERVDDYSLSLLRMLRRWLLACGKGK